MRIKVDLRRFSLLVLLAGLLFSTGCAMDEQSAPALAGPSGYGLSVTMTASPDVLARDGSSRSTIQLIARTADGKPATGQRFLIAASTGTLTETDVMIDRAGQATFGYQAPGVNVNATSASIQVVPVGTNFDNTTARYPVSIALLGPAFPTASFTFNPLTPGQFDQVTFDASATTLNGASCGGCSFAWDFGDGTTGGGRLTSHRFESRGTFAVTLTVTSADGTSTTVTKTVPVGGAQAITADIKLSPTGPTTGASILFDGRDSKTPDGVAIVDYQWDFPMGEPSTGSGATAITTFSAPGTYVVRLTIRDAVGRTATTTKNVDVAAPAAPPAP
jgi:PKD repeat protein